MEGTTIVLPAVPSYRFDAATLADLDARVLLFLNKLEKLELIQGSTSCLFKRSNHKGVTHLTTTTTDAQGAVTEVRQRYVRVEKTFAMDGDFADEKRRGVGMSKVVLAFPVEPSNAVRLEPSSYVFAYLPIHQVGFKFPFHADFILNSGREAVLNDRPWNLRLRDGIAAAFVDSIDHFRKYEALGLSYLNYVPGESDVSDDFFGSVRQHIVEGLSKTASLPSASGTWYLPSELRTTTEEFRALFPSTVARQLFDFDYMDGRVQGAVELLRELGVAEAGYREVLEVFRSHGSWLGEQSLQWRAKLYAYIADNLEPFKKAGLLNAPCVPVAGGGYVAPAKTNVFFPLAKAKKYGFEHELTILDGELYEASSKLSESVPALFAALSVRPDDPYDMVAGHILPKHVDESWKRSKHPALIGHLRYVKDKLEPFIAGAALRGRTRAQALEMLRDGMWVGTRLVSEEGVWTFSRVGGLYLGREYKPDFCIDTLLSGEPGASDYVSADYLTKKTSEQASDAAGWREFLKELGIRTCPALEKVGGDWHFSTELTELLESDSPATRRQTLECLSLHWDTYYANKLTYFYSYRNRTQSAETTFAEKLRDIEVPLKGRKSTAPLSETYSQTLEIKEILGDSPPYVDAYLSPSMLDDCQVTRNLDANALVKRLRQLKQEGSGTTQQVQRIYRALENRWESDHVFIRDSFQTYGLIQMKGTTKGWFSPSQC